VVAGFSAEDLRGALAVVEVVSSTDGPAPFPEPVVEAVSRLVPGDVVGYSEWELYRATTAVELPAVATPPDVLEARRTYCQTYPLCNIRRSSETRALKVSDFLSARALHRLDYYDSVLRPFGIEHELRMWLPAPPGKARVFSIKRAGRGTDFTERDRCLLELLRPFLALRRDRLDRCTDPADLTEREVEILRWVSRGKTNREIAALLVVSPHTVRKHLEHAYEKLGVHTRTAAAARVSSWRS